MQQLDLAGREEIVLLVPYFGPLPSMANLAFRTFGHNRRYTMLVITDQPEPAGLPDNVRFVPATLAEVRALAEERLGCAVNLCLPYKLCDLKPTYGIVFAHLIGKASFWGHCDLDIIFGDLDAFIPTQALAAYDKLFVRGHFSLYRNTERMNNLFRLNAPGLNWQDVLKSVDNFYFDEWSGIYRIIQHHGIPVFMPEVVADISCRRYNVQLTAHANHASQVLMWDRGQVKMLHYDDNGCHRERHFMYAHMQKRRMRAPGAAVLGADRFYITPDGFNDAEQYLLADAVHFQALNPHSLAGDVQMRLRRMRFRARMEWRKFLLHAGFAGRW